MVAVVLLVCVSLAGCAEVLAPENGAPVSPQTTGPAVSPTTSYPPPDLSKPFVTWDGKTAVPFIYSVRADSPSSDTAATAATAAAAAAEAATSVFLGLWDLEKGTVSFIASPLFSLDGHISRASWDGGDRFAFAGSKVTPLDPRIRIENVDVSASDSWAGPGYRLAAPSDSDALFIAYMDGDNKPVLDIRNHPLAGRIVMDLPELAPGTSVLGPVAIETGQDEVRVYFETSRKDRDVDSGALTYVQGVLRGRYYPAATARPVQWRIVNPEVPAFVAGGGTTFRQFRGEIVMSTQGRRPEVLDLVTGAVSAPPEFDEELKKADPDFVNGDGADICYGYGEYRIVNVNYLRGATAEQVGHVFAFASDGLVGRIEFTDDQVSVFKDGAKTFETARPQSGGGVFRFPQDVEPLSKPEPGTKTFGPREYDAVWRTARYADLFNETLRTDGWLTEQAAIVLMDRFSADPTGFVRSLAVAPDKEVERVGDCLAYNADYRDLNSCRKQVEGLKKGFPPGKELDVLDNLLERITQFEIRMGRKPGR